MESSATEYVPQKIFDLQLEDIKFRTNAERERVDEKHGGSKIYVH